MKRPGPSILKMAEAMLEEDYRNSHTNLKEWGDDNEYMELQQKQSDTCTDPNAADMKKSDSRSVVIQVPPKRRKISCAYSAKEVVDGKLRLSCAGSYFAHDTRQVVACRMHLTHERRCCL